MGKRTQKQLFSRKGRWSGRNKSQYRKKKRKNRIAERVALKKKKFWGPGPGEEKKKPMVSSGRREKLETLAEGKPTGWSIAKNWNNLSAKGKTL